MIFAARNMYFLVWMYVILTSILVLALAYNILYAIALRQPMLTLTPRFLIYRKVSIPWEFISDVTELKTPGGTAVGISLSQGYFRVTPTESSLMPRPTMGFFLRKSLAKYGAISIPQARGLTIDGLRQIVADYREFVPAPQGQSPAQSR